MARYTTRPLQVNVSHRQDVCDRYNLFRSGQIELGDALSGMELRPLMLALDLFEYSHETGIPEDAGLLATLMDELAWRGDFTWRQSFGVMEPAQNFNMTWTEMLLWGVETYDVAVYSWDQSIERMNEGVAYVEPFFDGSLILINQIGEEDDTTNNAPINFLNWTKPFEPAVWVLTLVTIMLSAVVYQLIEYLSDERDDRPMTQWFSDNVYLSWLNFTQNYEYAPSSVGGRIFGISMGLWGLVMTATYTANLANLFVENSQAQIVVESIDDAVALGYPVCIYGNTNADRMVREKYPYADDIFVPKATELEMFQAMQRGECKLCVNYMDNWLTFEGNKDYNPECDLEWVGWTMETIKSGMAVQADAGYKCTGFIKDVLNLHMVKLMQEGVLEDAWEHHRAKSRNVECELGDDTDASDERRRRRLGQTHKAAQGAAFASHSTRRKLKGAAKSASSSSPGSAESAMTVKQMLGTFMLHWVLMAFAILATVTLPYLQKWLGTQTMEKVIYRQHGPIIGMPPPMNTYKASTRDLNSSSAVPEPYSPDNYTADTMTGSQVLDSDGKSEDETGCQVDQQKDASGSPGDDWRESHANLQRHQQSLDAKMDLVLQLLQDKSAAKEEKRQDVRESDYVNTLQDSYTPSVDEVAAVFDKASPEALPKLTRPLAKMLGQSDKWLRLNDEVAHADDISV